MGILASGSQWGVYHGLLAAVPAAAAPAVFERAAQGLEERVGFEEAAAFLRGASLSPDNEGLQRRARVFLGRRDLASALIPQAGALAEAAGLDPESLLSEGLTRPERFFATPWWFESVHPPREGRGTVRMEEGALAVGDERALAWLIRVRDRAEKGMAPEGFSANPHLIWIPSQPAQALALNVLGGVFRHEGESFEDVNGEGRLRIRALFPFPRPESGTYFLMGRNIPGVRSAAALCREGKMPWKMVHDRLEGMAKKIDGIREVRSDRSPGVRRVLIRNPGVSLPLNDRIVPYPRSARPLPAERAFVTFRHQFWDEMPETLEERIGSALMMQVPEDAIIHQYQFLHPQCHMPTGYGRSLYGKPGIRFFFIDAGRTWWGQATEQGIVDRSADLPDTLMDYLSGLTGFSPPRRASDPAVPEAVPEQKVEKMDSPEGVALDPTLPVSFEREDDESS